MSWKEPFFTHGVFVVLRIRLKQFNEHAVIILKEDVTLTA